MENEEVKITLADGTEIKATINGNNYLPETAVDTGKLTDENLVKVKIGDQTHENLTACNVWTDEAGQQHIVFHAYTAAEMARKKLEAQLAYVAAMGGVEL